MPFFSISGSDFIEMFVGVGASRVRDPLPAGERETPRALSSWTKSDAVGRRRAVDLHGASAEGAQTLNAILVEMDGFGTDDAVIVISATNRPDVLDPRLAAAGAGSIGRSSSTCRTCGAGRAILRVHARKYKLAADVDLKVMARGTPSFSGADLEALMNEGCAHRHAGGEETPSAWVDMEEAPRQGPVGP